MNTSPAFSLPMSAPKPAAHPPFHMSQARIAHTVILVLVGVVHVFDVFVPFGGELLIATIYLAGGAFEALRPEEIPSHIT